MTELLDHLAVFWNQLPTLSGTTICIMIGMSLFATFLARVILQATTNGLPILGLGMLAGSYLCVHIMRYGEILPFGRTELMDASIASMIGIGVSILPVVLLMRLMGA